MRERERVHKRVKDRARDAVREAGRDGDGAGGERGPLYITKGNKGKKHSQSARLIYSTEASAAAAASASASATEATGHR